MHHHRQIREAVATIPPIIRTRKHQNLLLLQNLSRSRNREEDLQAVNQNHPQAGEVHQIQVEEKLLKVQASNTAYK